MYRQHPQIFTGNHAKSRVSSIAKSIICFHRYLRLQMMTHLLLVLAGFLRNTMFRWLIGEVIMCIGFSSCLRSNFHVNWIRLHPLPLDLHFGQFLSIFFQELISGLMFNLLHLWSKSSHLRWLTHLRAFQHSYLKLFA